MTYTSQELREQGVCEEMLAFRAWRRAMHLSQLEAAAMAGVCERALFRAETGLVKPRRATLEKLQALMQRWDESKRPPRGPERRGAHLNSKRRVVQQQLPHRGGADGPL